MLQAVEHQPSVERRQDAAGQPALLGQFRANRRASLVGDGTALHIAVSTHVLGQGVQNIRGAKVQRTLHDRGGKGPVHNDLRPVFLCLVTD